MSAVSYKVDYKPLSPSRPGLGAISLLPWDSEIFGFNVAEFIPADAPPSPDLGVALEAWATEQKAQLISVRLPADRADWLLGLQQANFRVVDCVAVMGFNNLQKAKLVPSPLPVREATSEDKEALTKIAFTGFKAGRYHADPLFPKELADRRYEQWIRNSFEKPAPGTLQLVAEHEGQPAGFTLSVITGTSSVGQLTCVRPDLQNNIFGFALSAGQTHYLKARGIVSCRTRLSVKSIPLIRMNLLLQHAIFETEYILHWHFPGGLLSSAKS
jgi:hypothetical protein